MKTISTIVALIFLMISNPVSAGTEIDSSPGSTVTTSTGAELTKADGDLDFACKDVDNAAKPYNTFYFYSYYKLKPESENKNLENIDDDGFLPPYDLFYKVEVVQMSDSSEELATAVQKVSGCEFAPIDATGLKLANNGGAPDKIKFPFECGKNGVDGKGSITINMSDFQGYSVDGEMSFPNAKTDLVYPIAKDSTYSLSCTDTE